MNITCASRWESLEADLMIVPASEDRRLQQLSLAAARLGETAERLSAALECSCDKRVMLLGRGSEGRVCLIGVGKRWDPAGLRKGVRQFLVSSPHLQGSLGVDLHSLEGEDALLYVQAAVEGCVLGDYDPGLYKGGSGRSAQRPEDRARVESLALLVPPPLLPRAEARARRAVQIACAQREVLDLVNQPGNVLTPARLAEEVRRAGRRDGYTVQILGKEEIQREGMEAFLAVNLGSARPPALIVLDYRPEKAPGAPVIGLLGKGITFDSGGISLKPSAKMQFMKSDMAGAAAVVGAVGAAARLGLPLHVVGVIPATDNMPDGAALNPGDVIGSKAGVTIEVENTDAEGRLVLADALTYVRKHFDPEVIVDLATLTGACLVALGDKAAGLFTDNDELAARLTEAGRRSGERLWRLPLWEEYDCQLESQVADLKNDGGPNAGATTAARFLARFAGDHPAWAHLDIAGVAFPEADDGRFRAASGFGVRLLAEYLIERAG